MSAASIVTYIERKKSDLRKAKRAFMRKKKQKEARDLNTRFHADPGGVFAQFSRMVEQDADNNKPNYKTTKQTSKDDERVFESIQDACSYWKHLWETSGSTANTKPGWLVEVRRAFEKLVPVPRQDSFQLNQTKCADAIKKKRNWSAPGPDRIANYWWKRAVTLHEGTAASFKTILTGEVGYPSWFTGGRTNLIPKPGELSSQNQRPITCLNTQYKWFTTCLLSPMDEHLETHNLLEEEQRGARTKCSGTLDNLMIDKMVCRDSRNGSRNLSMAWIDVRKAFDSVSHAWLQEMMTMHKFPLWMCRTVARLCESWNTKITARTKEGYKTSDLIRFNKGLPQGDALCPRLFTLCLNPISWKLKASEGYKLSRPLSGKITHLLYIDDMKIYAASKDKLERVMKTVKEAMADVGLEWNEKKCSTAHVRRGSLDSSLGGTAIGERQVIQNLKKGETYKFLGVLENSKQEDRSVLWGASKVCLQRLSIIWSSPLSDFHKVLASNQYALPVVTYPMWTLTWPLADLQQLDREARKIIKENGGYHPLGSTELLYLPRKCGGRGLKSFESLYKQTKVKTTMKLYANEDRTMSLVREFEEKCERAGRRSLVKDAKKFALEMDITLDLAYPDPKALQTDSGEESHVKGVGRTLRAREEERSTREVREQRWQGSCSEKDGMITKLLTASLGLVSGSLHLCILLLESMSYTSNYPLLSCTTRARRRR